MRDDLKQIIHDLMVIRNRFDDRTEETPAERMKRYHAQHCLTDMMTFLNAWMREI